VGRFEFDGGEISSPVEHGSPIFLSNFQLYRLPLSQRRVMLIYTVYLVLFDVWCVFCVYCGMCVFLCCGVNMCGVCACGVCVCVRMYVVFVASVLYVGVFCLRVV